MASKKVNEILNNEKYKDYLKKLGELESIREFCRHNMEHFLDVSRIAYIINLEENLGFSKDVIYAIGLLHDIGRVLEYEKGIPHHEGSVILAKIILDETSYNKGERNQILKAIDEHREESEDELSKLIYKSDKLSRNCFGCKVQDKCYWPKRKKNLKIKY